MFEFLAIYKLILSYTIKNDGIKWFMVLDYIFIFLNTIYILIYVCFTRDYFECSGSEISISKKNVLVSFNGINIAQYELPSDFDKYKKMRRKKFILDKYKRYSPLISEQQLNLITSINDYRGINNIPLLGVCHCYEIPDFIINENSEVMLHNEQNIFKISDEKYLLKFPIGEFENLFDKKDIKIINIILKENLNHIQIITLRQIEYIFIYEINICRDHITDFSHKSSRKKLFSLDYSNGPRSYLREYESKHIYE